MYENSSSEMYTTDNKWNMVVVSFYQYTSVYIFTQRFEQPLKSFSADQDSLYIVAHFKAAGMDRKRQRIYKGWSDIHVITWKKIVLPAYKN